MKKYIIFIIIFCVPLFFKAQENKEIDLKELQITTAPSAVLLGISPSELETPKSKKAIVLNIVNSFKKNEGIPDNYAFEVTPFWLFTPKEMTALKYAGIVDNSRQNIFNEVKKASFSLGFVRDLVLEPNEEIKNPAFAFSVRTTLIKIRTKKNKDSIISQNAKVKKILDKVLVDLTNYPNRYEIETELFKKCLEENDDNQEFCQKTIIEKVDAFLKVKDEKYKSDNVNYYRNLMEAPPLFALDFAGGYSTFFSDNKFSDNHFGKLGLWMTLNTGFDFTNLEKPNVEKKLNFYGIARYLEDGTTLDIHKQFFRTKNFDFGGKAEFVYNRFSISYEYIYRVNDIENTFRSSGLLAYKISDKVYINAAFGKNYGEKDNLISFLGLNWGLDSERKTVIVK